MNNFRSSWLKRGTRYRLSMAALASILLLAPAGLAEEKTPAARLGKPRVKSALPELNDAPAMLPLEMEPKPVPLLPLVLPTAVEETMPVKQEEVAEPKTELFVVPPVESPVVTAAKASEVLLKKSTEREHPKSTPATAIIPSMSFPPIATVSSTNSTVNGTAPAMNSPVNTIVYTPVNAAVNTTVMVPQTPMGGMAQTRWSIYEERMGGAAPIQVVTNNPSPEPLARSQTVLVVPALANAIPVQAPIAIKAIPVDVSQQAPKPVVPVVAQVRYLPGTFVPVSTSAGKPEVSIPEVPLQEILQPRPPMPVASRFETNDAELPKKVVLPVVTKPVYKPEVLSKVVEPKEVPIKVAPGEWVAASEPRKSVSEIKTPPRQISAPVTAPVVIGSASANSAAGSRAQSFFQNDEGSSRWQSRDNVAVAPPAAAVTPTPIPRQVPAPASQVPAVETKVVPASMTASRVPATAPAAEMPLPTPYTLMPWQWVERIRTVAGPSATNLVALVNSRGGVKVKFDCQDEAEAKSIAARVSAIAEFRKLSIDFDINSH